MLAVAVGMPVRALADEPAAPPASCARPRLAPAAPAGAVRFGRLDPQQPVEFDVSLAPSHPAELASLLRALYDPASPRYHQWLAAGEFARRFGPEPSRVDAVVDWLHGAGLTDTRVVDGRVEVRAAAGAASRALGVSFAALPGRGRLGELRRRRRPARAARARTGHHVDRRTLRRRVPATSAPVAHRRRAPRNPRRSRTPSPARRRSPSRPTASAGGPRARSARSTRCRRC